MSAELLSLPQLEKFERVRKYLSVSIPNEWKTLAELDQTLPQGAQLARFPWEWVRALQSECQGSVYGLQVKLPTVISGSGKEGIALCFHSLKFGTTKQLIGSLSSPEHLVTSAPSTSQSDSAPRTSSSLALSTVGLNTRDVSQVDKVSESVINNAIQTNVAYHILNISAGIARRLRTKGGTAGSSGQQEEDDEANNNTALNSFDGGRSELSQWLSNVPVKIVRSTVKTLRGVIETSYRTNVPMTLREGEEMEMLLQRQDIDPLGAPNKVIVTVFINNVVASVGGGLSAEPSAIEFRQDKGTAKLRWRANKTGAYVVRFDVTVMDASGVEIAASRFDRLRISVGDVFKYSHAINGYSIVQSDIIEGRGLIQPGGVLLYRQDPFCLPLPKEQCLSIYAPTGSRPFDGSTADPPQPQWWSNASPHIVSYNVKPDTNEIKACASRLLSGPFLFKAAADGSAPTAESNFDSMFRDADGNLDLAKVRAKQLADSKKTAERAREAAARKNKSKRRHKELTNKHLLNYGIDLRKPYRPSLN